MRVSDTAAEEPDVECTAFERSATTERNALFTPPCTCPRCVAPDYDTTPDRTTIWLRTEGPPVRHRVEDMTLGHHGQALLGDATTPRHSPNTSPNE